MNNKIKTALSIIIALIMLISTPCFSVLASELQSTIAEATNETAVETNNQKLMAPVLKNIVVTENGEFIFSWEAIAGADKYEIYYDNGTGYQPFIINRIPLKQEH